VFFFLVPAILVISWRMFCLLQIGLLFVCGCECVCDNTVANSRCYFSINDGTEAKYALYILILNLNIILYFWSYFNFLLTISFLFYFTVYLHLPVNIFSFPRNNNCLFVIRNFMENIVVNKISTHIDIQGVRKWFLHVFFFWWHIVKKSSKALFRNPSQLED